jgi:hypothetical protein
MKISKKNIIFIAAVLILILGVAYIFYEITSLRKDIAASRVDNEEYLSELFAAQVAEINATDGNTVTVEGCDIVLGQTTLQDFLNASGCSIDKDRGYYSNYDYYGYRYMSKDELDAVKSIDPVGSGTAYLYLGDKTTDIVLSVQSCEYVDDKSRTLPSYDRCYITGVQIQLTGGKNDYTFSYNGVDQDSSHEDYQAAFSDGEDTEPDYESDYYTVYRWKTGRDVTLREEVYTEQGEDLYNYKREVEISYYGY